MGAIIVTLFLSGPNGPIWGVLPAWLLGTVWFLLKLVVVLYVFVLVRGSVPRVLYDQLMDLGWKLLIPLSLGWLLLLVALRVGSNEGWNPLAVIGVSAVIGLTCWGLLALAMRVSRKNRLLEGVID